MSCCHGNAIVLRVFNLNNESHYSLARCVCHDNCTVNLSHSKSPSLKRNKYCRVCALPCPSLITRFSCVFMRDSRGTRTTSSSEEAIRKSENFTSVKHGPKNFQLQHRRGVGDGGRGGGGGRGGVGGRGGGRGGGGGCGVARSCGSARLLAPRPEMVPAASRISCRNGLDSPERSLQHRRKGVGESQL